MSIFRDYRRDLKEDEILKNSGLLMPIYILISDESAAGRRDDQQSWEQERGEDEDIAAQLMALKPMTEAEIDEIFVKNNVGDSEFLCD
jgi:hypothetical protein